MKHYYFLFLFIICSTFLFGLVAEAGCLLDPNDDANNECNYSGQYIPMIDFPGVTNGSGEAGSTSFASYASALYSVAIVVAALLAVIRLVLAGAKYMMTDVVSGKGEAINDIKGSLLGLLIIIAAFVILNTINPNLTKISIVSLVDNNGIPFGERMDGFTNINLGGPSSNSDCSLNQVFYRCNDGVTGCAANPGVVRTICAGDPSRPGIFDCDISQRDGVFNCYNAEQNCINEGGTPITNGNNGIVSCNYLPVSPTPPPPQLPVYECDIFQFSGAYNCSEAQTACRNAQGTPNTDNNNGVVNCAY